MLIRELAAPVDTNRLGALARFLANRAQDQDVKQEISGLAFINLAQSMQIPLTISQLKDLSQQPPLSNLISNIEGDDDEPSTVKIKFRANDSKPETMTVDQARDTVDSMAKRAAKRDL